MEENTRLPFEFVGTTSTPLSVDPAEYKGKTLPQVTELLEKQLAELSPGVTFFRDDIVLAAESIANANDE